MNKYFITGDLEITLPLGVKNSQINRISIDNKVRRGLFEILNFSFDTNGLVEFIDYDLVYNFFANLRKEDEFILALEDGIYIDGADFYFSSTRAYGGVEEIFDSSYSILQRDGSPIFEQNKRLLDKIFLSGKKEIIICDDGLFSGDTLRSVIYDLETFGIKVREIRVILNFTRSDNINGIPIVSMYSPETCIDWIDERDFFYGAKNSGASFFYKGKLNGLSYIANSKIANKKASIPIQSGDKFINLMRDLNIEVWQHLQTISNRTIQLVDLPRILYLQERFGINTGILEILKNV